MCQIFVTFLIWKILATPGGRMMHSERLIIEINIVRTYISDNIQFDHKTVRLNLTELFFLNS